MRSQVLIALPCLALATGAATFAACRQNAPAPGPIVAPALAHSAAPVASASASPAAPSASAATPSDPVGSAASAARHCDSPITQLEGPPAGAVVFSNAQTSAETGHSDRTQGVIDTIQKARHSYRCCFHQLLKRDPRAASALLVLKLDPAGKILHAGVDPTRSSIDDAVTLRCLSDVAASGDYPPSPKGRQTVVEYPFRVAAPSN